MRLNARGDLDLGPAESSLRWPWVVGCFTTGAALIAGAIVTYDGWQWRGLAPWVLLQVGSAIGLVGVLVLLERRITASVARSMQAPLCTLADPPAAITQRSVMGNGDPGMCTTPYGCEHRPIEHRWHSVTGARLPDHQVRGES